MFRSLLLALPLLVACTTLPPADTATLPRDAVTGAGDPTRTAIITTNAVFAEGRPAAGNPGSAARAIAQMEFLAVDLPLNNNVTNASPNLGSQMQAARREWRGALDIAPDAAAQPVINALYAASRALESGQRDAAAAALPSTIFRRGGQQTLAQLSALPNMPSTAVAAATAQQAIPTSRAGAFSL